jgi:uncharacterized membrane protein
MSFLTTSFLRGLAAVLPLALTVWVLYWLVTSAEGLLGSAWRWAFGAERYHYGLGLAGAVVLILVVGLSVNAFVVRRVVRAGERVLERTPLIKTIYAPLRDMLGFFTGTDAARFSQVVVVELAGARMLGFVTREEFGDLPEGVGGRDTVGVYLPMSYQLGGFLVMLPRRAVTPVAMTKEEALRFAVTAGVTAKVAGKA